MGSFRGKSADRPDELAILLGDLGEKVIAAAREELFSEVRMLTTQMRLICDRMAEACQTEAEHAICRHSLKVAADALAQAGLETGERLRANRLKDRNRPAYRRTQAVRRDK